MEILTDVEKVVGTIVGTLVGLATILTFFWKWFLKPKIREEVASVTNCEYMSSQINEKADKCEIEKLNTKIEEVSEKVDKVKVANDNSVFYLERLIEADKYIIQGLFACLDGLKQNGANGEVTKSYNTIQEYLIRRETIDKRDGS